MALNYSDAFVVFASGDIAKLTSFYTKILGQIPKKHIPNIYTEFQLPGVKLGIFKPKSDHELEFSNSNHSKMSLCLEVENLENAIAYLKKLDCTIAQKITIASHGREIYAFDPDGNRIILHEQIISNN
jgi:predicted enzyme related to lactoylglutathione lyase